MNKISFAYYNNFDNCNNNLDKNNIDKNFDTDHSRNFIMLI